MDDQQPPVMSSLARELLALERARGSAPAGAKKRSFARVGAVIAAGGAPSPTGKVAAGAKASVGIVKVGITLALGAAIGSAATVALQRTAEPPKPAPSIVVTSVASNISPAAVTSNVTPAVTSSVVMSGTLAPPKHEPPLAPSPVATPLPTSRVGAPHPRAATSIEAPHASELSLADERAVLDRARSALARKDAEAAIKAAREHESKFPRGQLGAEREAILIQALVTASRRAEAIDRAAHFHHKYPNNVLTPVVESAIVAAEK